MTLNNVKEIGNSNLKKIVVLPGDNIGAEVTAEAVKVLKAVIGIRSRKHGLQSVELVDGLVGGAAIDKLGHPLPPQTLNQVRDSQTVAILFGAIGGPQWDNSPVRPEQGLLLLRKELDVFANLRPCKFPSKSLVDESPLRPQLAQNVDFVIVRELCSGIYFGGSARENSEGADGSECGVICARDICKYSSDEIERVTRIACQLAMQRPERKLTLVDKANVLETSRLWREIVERIVSSDFPQLQLAHQYVDAAAMHIVRQPRMFNGVVLTSNLFGDILSDESSVIVGSLGLLPSASLSTLEPLSRPGLYEPIHGSAPDIAGRGIANPVGSILSAAMLVRYSLGWTAEADAIESAVERVLDGIDLGGFGYRTADLGGQVSTRQFGDKVCEVVREIIGEISAREFSAVETPRAISPNEQSSDKSFSSWRPLNVCEKILLHHAVGLPKSSNATIRPGDLICVNVDWTLASELTWKGMEKTFDEMGRPQVFRNDRFWLAVDHTVDPSINDQRKPRELILASETFAKEANIKDFHGPNQTILHTDFYRERAQPGMLVIGADSHSCSAGGLGTFAVGLGAADVVMPLVTGQTWFKVPETVNIRFVGRPPMGIGGKDVILWVLGELKRNTVAFERAVEFTGSGCKYLSCDARFAIANMATEFGGIAGVFEPDEITAAYIDKRENAEYKTDSVYFKADKGAEYSAVYEIDLSKIESMVALYPSPDHVVPVTEVEGMQLDGVFIGACTTAEEDLILAALVLEQGLNRGFTPSIAGIRKVTPGSLSIVANLKRLGLIDIYERAGFTVGAPGCSYCLGIAADKAGEGEIWLSSQNRNFKNRMGKGSIGNLASAATVAASSFDMRVADPQFLLDAVDFDRFKKMLGVWGVLPDEHDLSTIPEQFQISYSDVKCKNSSGGDNSCDLIGKDEELKQLPLPPKRVSEVFNGRVQKFGDHVDTDAIIPAEFMPGTSDVDLGSHCFQYFRPEFRERVQQGYSIVVAGTGFGSGSSREEAPRALLGCGVKVVCAQSFAFIYARNQSNMALLGITPQPWNEFYEFVQEGADVNVDISKRSVTVVTSGGESKGFTFLLSIMEERLLSGGGVTRLYQKYGKDLFRVAMQPEPRMNDNRLVEPVEKKETGTGEIKSQEQHQHGQNKFIGGLVGMFPKLAKKTSLTLRKHPLKHKKGEEEDVKQCDQGTSW